MNNEESTINNEESTIKDTEVSPGHEEVSPVDELLLGLMDRVGISSFKTLSRKSGVPEKQLRRLRRGEVSRLRWEFFGKLSEALEVPISQFLTTFADVGDLKGEMSQEYQRLQAQLSQQRQELMLEFQQSSLAILESWLRQWPTAADRATRNPDLSAAKLLPLVRPVEQLVQEWGVEPIAHVGAEVPYDPQWHQLSEDGTAQTGDRVIVVRLGYRHGEKLLYRAEVKPLGELQ